MGSLVHHPLQQRSSKSFRHLLSFHCLFIRFPSSVRQRSRLGRVLHSDPGILCLLVCLRSLQSSRSDSHCRVINAHVGIHLEPNLHRDELEKRPILWRSLDTDFWYFLPPAQYRLDVSHRARFRGKSSCHGNVSASHDLIWVELTIGSLWARTPPGSMALRYSEPTINQNTEEGSASISVSLHSAYHSLVSDTEPSCWKDGNDPTRRICKLRLERIPRRTKDPVLPSNLFSLMVQCPSRFSYCQDLIWIDDVDLVTMMHRLRS